MNYNGTLSLIIGPMFSGKTTELMVIYNLHKTVGERCLLVKYAGDTRYSETHIITHSGQSEKALSCTTLQEIDDMIIDCRGVKDYDVVLIDEIQFYPDAAQYCEKWANNGIMVVCSGLSGTYKREPFEQISRLIPLSDEIIHLTAKCEATGRKAPFSKRLSGVDDKVVIGGAEMYKPASRAIYFSESK